MEFIVAGIVLGGLYAIVAAGLVITNTSAGVLNFGFGAEAYFIARFYYYLNTQLGWPIWSSAIVSIVVAGPVLGVVLYFLVFRFLQVADTLVKIVATIGLAVALPPLAVLCFGNSAINVAPGLAPSQAQVVHVLGVAISWNQIIVLLLVVLCGLVAAVVFRFTSAGLAMRAVVDSPALTSNMGTNPNLVCLVVWIANTFLAGLSGVLIAPLVGLGSPDNFTLLVVAAFSAVVVGKLTSVGRTVIAGFLLGVLEGIVQWKVPANSIESSAALTSIPFVVSTVFVIYYGVKRETDDTVGRGGRLDNAIAYQDTRYIEPLDVENVSVQSSRDTSGRWIAVRTAMVFAILALVPLFSRGIWLEAVGLGFAYAVVLLSNTIVAGEGGLISLCQITFAGVGAVAAAQLSTVYHWPVLAAMVVGGVIATPLGLLLGAVSLRLGRTYLALVTLTFGVLMDSLVFTLNRFSQYGEGVQLARPPFATGDRQFAYFCLIVFVLFGIFLMNMRHSTTGLGVGAARWSEVAARSLGIGVMQLRVVLTGIGAFVAGVGGALLAMDSGFANPASYATLGGLVWLAIGVSIGIRSLAGAALGGLSLSLLPVVFINYLPASLGQLPTVLFGLGAIIVVRNPDGVIALHARQLRGLAERLRPAGAGTAGSGVWGVPGWRGALRKDAGPGDEVADREAEVRMRGGL
jgi:branched-chain amino acid transport system permease protein